MEKHRKLSTLANKINLLAFYYIFHTEIREIKKKIKSQKSSHTNS